MTEAEAATAAEKEPTLVCRVFDPAPGALHVKTDGIQGRYQAGWNEIKLGLAAGYIGGDVVAPTDFATQTDSTVFGLRLMATAVRGTALNVVVWQGGLWERALAVLRPVVVLEARPDIDFWRFCGRLWARRNLEPIIFAA